MIPYGKQDINSEDIEAVINVLKSDFLTQGPQVPAFEKCVAEYAGAKYGCAANSATSALHIACLAIGLGKGDELWTSPNTFVASANCALYCGAQVDFVDIDPKTYNICPEKLEHRLANAKKLGKLPKVIVAVHLCGQSCDMKSIYKLSKIYGFKIIEDASHAVGGRYLDSKIGDCRYSDITIFSFHPVKIITTAEGGMACTNSEKLYNKMNLLRSHGISRNIKHYWKYDVEDSAFALMRNNSGVIASIHSTATQWKHKFNIEITCEKATLILSGILSGSKSYGKEKLIILNKKNDKFIKKTFRYHQDNSWKEEIAEFTDIILNNKKVINGNSHQALEVMMMVQNIYNNDKEWKKKINYEK